MIASVHIHKNGGMQFKQFLTKSFGNKLLLEYGKDNQVLKRFFSGGNNRPPVPSEYHGVEVVHGHFLANRFDGFDDVKLITFLRDPAQRIISNYYFFKRNFYAHSPICQMIKAGMTLEEYIELESSKNVQSFFLADKKIDDFFFVGILEEYEASINILKKKLGLKFRLVNHLLFYSKMWKSYLESEKNLIKFESMSANKNSDKSGDSYKVSELLLSRIKANNSLDYEIYNRVRNEFYNV